MKSTINTIRLATADDAEATLAIYRPFVTDTTVSFEFEPPSVEEMRRRIEETTAKYPWLVWERAAPRSYGRARASVPRRVSAEPRDSGTGQVLGYAYASLHRSRPAYQWSVEVSVYVHPDARRSGIARALYQALFERLREQGFYNAFAGITLPNEASVGFHEAMGFAPIGVFPKVGHKFGKWWDVGWWGLRLREGEPEFNHG